MEENGEAAEIDANQKLRIFVSVASYRDPETPATLFDLFSKAAHPLRIFCGVLWQVVPGEDDDCLILDDSLPLSQIRGKIYHPRDSQGACWARSLILTKLRGGEEFVLQIDSHMRFVDGWDEILLAMWRSCKSARALLSTYPVAYVPPDKLGEKAVTILCPRQFNHKGILTFGARSESYSIRPASPEANAFVSAGFLFGPAKAFDEVPYDPNLYFHGEEVSLSARLWTNGWDAYTPNDVVTYHNYIVSEKRPRHWTDNPDWGELDKRSLSRLRHLFGIESSGDPAVVNELEKYALGSARTLSDYEKYADVDFVSQKIGARGWTGHYPPHPAPEVLEDIRIFSRIYEKNLWSCDETRSGSRAARGATMALVLSLQKFFAEKKILRLLDAGCGDVNWIFQASSGLEYYFGIDLVEGMIQQNIRLHSQRQGCFFSVGDIGRVALPKADAIICRHVLTHQSNKNIHAALENFLTSGASWLILTSYDAAENDDVSVGEWRKLNLTKAPFNFPPPVQQIQDGGGCWLGVWYMDGAPRFVAP